ncbi:MAG: tetratricopeptide repeat protein [Cyanobacteria bacterium J06639_1]
MSASSQNKWFVKVVLGLASLAFLGAPLVILFGGIFQSSSTHTTDNYAAVESNQREQLQTLAEGYAEVLEREPDNFVALQGLMEARLQLGQVREAIAPMAKLSELDPENVQLALVLGQARIQAGQSADAIAQLLEMQAERPNNASVVALLGEAYTSAGQHQEAIAVYQALVDENPDNADASLQLAEALTRGDRRGDAIDLFDRLITDNPNNFQAIAGKAIAIASNPDVTDAERDEAEVLFEQARATAPPSMRVQIAQIAQQYVNPVPVNLAIDSTETEAPDNSARSTEGSAESESAE